MAIRYNASGEQHSRTTNTPPGDKFTIMAWVRVDSSTGDNQCFWEYTTDSASADGYQVSRANADGTIGWYNGSTGANGMVINTAQWYHVAMTARGTTTGGLLIYVNGYRHLTGDCRSLGTLDWMRFSDDVFGNPFNGRLAAIKVWSDVLKPWEIPLEMQQYAPVHTSDINGFYPLTALVNDEIDYSGMGNNLTPAGTLTEEEGPPIPWSLTQFRRRVFDMGIGGGGGGISIPVAMHNYRRRRVA